jgi:hypothetical protein
VAAAREEAEDGGNGSLMAAIFAASGLRGHDTQLFGPREFAGDKARI